MDVQNITEAARHNRFLKTADRTEIEVFFEILQEQSSLRGEKRPYHKFATPV